MGLFNKLKNVLFEEEEIDDEVETPSTEPKVEESLYKDVSEYKPLPEHKEIVKPKEPVFEKVKTEEKDYSERELFKSETTFKFPAFDEEEFDKSMPALKAEEEPKPVNNSFDFERRKREEKKNEYSRVETNRFKEEVKEEKKRFKPSPVISPVYGILDKDYKVDDIMEATPNGGTILTNKDLDVESVRAKAFGKLKNITEEKKEKPVIVQETYEIKKEKPKEEKIEELKIDDVIISEEPIIDDAEDLMKERTKTIDELLKDASDEIIDVEDTITDNLDLTEEYRKIEDEIDSALDLTSHIEPVVEDEEEIKEDKKESKKEKKSSLENDTLENDLYDLIDSMYDNTEDGE